MAKSLNKFLNEVQQKGVRLQNYYELEIISGYDDVDKVLEKIDIWAETAEVPSRTQEYTDLPYNGYPLQIPTTFLMQNEHALTIRSDMHGNIRKAFLKWMAYVTDPAISQGSGLGGDKRIPANSYVRMHLLASDMETRVETYKLMGVGVQEVGIMSLSNATAEVATFDVTLKSQFHEIENNQGDFEDLF